MNNQTIIQIKNLSLYYGHKEIFKDINLTINKHKITAIIGPSGIGKSSLLQILNQMIREDNNAKILGEVIFENKNILSLKNKNLPMLRKKIVYVNQHPDLLPFSIFENVAFGLRLQKEKQKNIEIKVQEVLQKVYLWDEVKDRLHVKASMLSGGQQQRLILARALILEPQILLLDEPTASLNEILALKIENLLQELKKEMSIIMISHFQTQVHRIADTVFNMELLNQKR